MNSTSLIGNRPEVTKCTSREVRKCTSAEVTKCASRFTFLFLALPLLLISTQSSGQYTKLYDFGSIANGATTYSSLYSDGTFLYGTTAEGGNNLKGTIYKVKPDGSGFTVIHHFDGATGNYPASALISAGGSLYGTTVSGGANSQGTIFRINPDGTGFTDIFDFTYAITGAFPYGSLFFDGTSLFGMTSQGGSFFSGVVFKVNPDGSNYTKLLELDYTNNGSRPYGSLISDGTFLYGMTSEGGPGTFGTAFKIKKDGTGYVQILNFSGANGNSPVGSFISDGTFLYATTLRGGANNKGCAFRIMMDGTNYGTLVNLDNATGTFPKGDLTSDGTFLYGTTTQDGANFRGSIFRVLPNGTGFLKIAEETDYTSSFFPEGTLLLNGSILYGTKSNGGTARLGSIFKISTGGSNRVTVHSFERVPNKPTGTLVSDGNFLYGMTAEGGAYNVGAIYKIRPDGSNYAKIFDFDNGADGSRPSGSLMYDGSFLYGMTTQGGSNDNGLIFKIKTDGTGFIDLESFNGNLNGQTPQGSLISDGTFLYGMTSQGGINGYGVIFKMNINGTGFTKLHEFDLTNGGYPNGNLISDGTFLYGLTYLGGVDGYGTLFKIKTDGTGFVTLWEFDYDDGSYPLGSLVSDGTFLYGLTSQGGANANGIIFKIKNDGSGFVNMFDFDVDDTGGRPTGGLNLIGTTLFGTTPDGGALSNGTMFKINTNGTGFTKVMDFSDGRAPLGSLLSDGTFLYGTSSLGGTNTLGTAFKVSIAPFVKVTDVIPAEGVVGTYITIKGTGFHPTLANNIVDFAGIPATKVSGSTDSLVVIVPEGATTTAIKVTTPTTSDFSPVFDVTSESVMFNGIVQSCDVTFVEPDGSSDDYVIQTFKPSIAGQKLTVSWSAWDVGDFLYVFDGPDTSYTQIAALGNDDPTPPDFTATSAGGELTFYWVWDDDHSDWTGNISCPITIPTITITQQPADASVCPGQIATFTIAASGATNIAYQWQSSLDGIVFVDVPDGAAYLNPKTATLSIQTAQPFVDGVYRCRISGDLAAPVFTTNVEVILKTAATAPVAVSNATICGPASKTISATGGNAGEYRWYTTPTGGTVITGETNGTFTTPTITAPATFYVSLAPLGLCESARTPVIANVQACNAPVITTAPQNSSIGSIITVDLSGLITDTENNVDLTTLKIVSQPASGAVAKLNGTTLTIDYTGLSFTGGEAISIEVCDLTSLCTTKSFNIEIAGEFVVYNAVSPNGDGKNDYFLLEFIDVLTSTKDNQVRIFNRWGDEVFSVANYNNKDHVFKGINNNGKALSSGTYFYRITFSSGLKTMTGHLELKQ